ncbi:MAG: hypothetical protein C0510_05975 [Erythrobacter sp.]|nr:hypothetical protein [Erythrobacter sp.]
MRALFAPRQRYTDTLMVGVIAAANDGGSLLDNLGLEKVIAHYEGNTLDILAPSVQLITDANGALRSYVGWWVNLQHSGTYGKANLYFEAVPKDPAMQHRVIGPFAMHPAAQLYDYQIEIAPSQPVIVGQRYTSLEGMRSYLSGQAADTALVTITEPGDHNIHAGAFGNTWNRGAGAGWLTITATAPVRILTPLNANGLPQPMRPRIEPICWRGQNITIDMFQSSEYFMETTWLYTNWFDGVRFTNSNGRNDLFRKRPRNELSAVLRGQNYVTECSFDKVWEPGNAQALVRGCSFTECWGDALTGSQAVIDCTLTDHDGTWFRDPVAALTVQYTGPAATATIRATGSSTSKTWTLAEDGVDVSSLATLSTEAAFLANTVYTVENVAAWINARAGWSATVLDSTRAAYGLGLATGTPGAGFAAIDAKTAPLTFHTRFDIHADIYQHVDNSLLSKENVILWGVRGWELVAQDIFLAGLGGMSDVLVANCAFHNKASDGQFSQMQRAHSHVMLVHNSWASQGVWFRGDLGYTADVYCLAANNTAAVMGWVGATDADLTIAANHLQDGATVPAGATGTTIGGTGASLFADAAAGAFTPAGELLANLKASALKWDRNKAIRSPSTPAGSEF